MELLTLQKFQQLLTNELESIHLDNTKFRETSDQLAFWCCRHLVGLTKEKAEEACELQGPGERGIDIFYVDEPGEVVIIGQAETGNTLDLKRKIGRGIVTKLNRALNFLSDPKVGKNERIYQAAQSYSDALSRKFKVVFWAIVGGSPNRGLLREMAAFQRGVLRAHPRHTAQIRGAGDLLLSYSTELMKRPYPTIELKINQSMKHPPDSLIVTAKASSIADAVIEEGLSIFELNARLPIQNSDVNDAIQDTVKTPRERVRFWNYNNGLTIICRGWTKRKGRIRLVEAQIVNGCQTAWTLSKNPKSLTNVEVLCRITRTDDEPFANVVRRATNWQNAISERDLRSGDLVQKNLQLEFQRLGYYYERKRDEWTNNCLSSSRSAMESRFKNGNIDNQKLAQLHLAFWNHMPAQAKSEKAKIFRIERSRFFGS